MNSWFSLYKKELRTISFFMLVSLLLILGWQLFLWYKLSGWPEGLTLGLGFMPFAFFPLVLLWQGYQSIRQEWKNDTIYFLLSFPCPGWQITLSKLAAGATYYLAVMGFNLFLVYVINIQIVKRMLPTEINPEWIMHVGIRVLIVYFLYGIVLYILSQFASLVSRFYHRFKGLISIVVFITSSYLIYRVGSLIAPLFVWLPDIPVEIVNAAMGQVKSTTVYVSSAPIIGLIVSIVTLFFLGSWIMANHLEV